MNLFKLREMMTAELAESVLIAGMFVYIGREFARLYKALGNDEMYENVSYEIKKMTEAVLEHGYDGEWFIRAYDANGNKDVLMEVI